jgi:EmrB/QacA subfamily drug resistance transporter
VERKWWTLLAVCMGIFMLLMDITVVNVALPTLQRSLHASFSDLQWVVDSYTLTLASFLLTAGVLGDIYGRRRLFAIGLGIFCAASLACGLSTTPLMLNLSRAVQGVGGAIMFATSLALIAQAFSGKERGIAFGIYGSVIGGAVAIGPLIGGALTSGIGWRSIFFINLPIGVVAIVITLAKVTDIKLSIARRIDWAGFILSSASLFMLVYALVDGNSVGWSSAKIIGLLTASALSMAAFLLVEWRISDPMLDLSLFKRPAMVGVSISAFAISSSIFAMYLYITLYLQDVLGYSPFEAGVRLLPITVLAFVVPPFAGRLTLKVASRYLLGLGLGLIALGCTITTDVGPHSTWMVLLPGFIFVGIGMGITNPVVASATVSVVPIERSGMASGTTNTFRQVGIATGVAGLGAVFTSQIRSATGSALAATAAGKEAVAHGGSTLTAAIQEGDVRQAASVLPESAGRAFIDAYQVGFTATFNHLMAIAGVVALIGAIAALTLVRQRDFLPSTPSDTKGSNDDGPALAGRSLDEPHPSRLAPEHPGRDEILGAHHAAMLAGQPGYSDPETGLFVLTAGYLADRQTCCESGCRHCPYVA